MAYLSPMNPSANFHPHNIAFDKDDSNEFANSFYRQMQMMSEMQQQMESTFGDQDSFGKIRNIPMMGGEEDESHKKKWFQMPSFFKKQNAFDPFSALTKRNMQMSSSISIDVAETPKQYDITASVPGFEKNEIRVEVDEDRFGQKYLAIRAEKGRQVNQQDEHKRFVYRESAYASASRSIPLPNDVDTEKVKAKIEHGQLHITLPKAENGQAKSQGHKIAIQ